MLQLLFTSAAISLYGLVMLLIAASLPVLAMVLVYGGAELAVVLGITLLCLVNALFAASDDFFVELDPFDEPQEIDPLVRLIDPKRVRIEDHEG